MGRLLPGVASWHCYAPNTGGSNSLIKARTLSRSGWYAWNWASVNHCYDHFRARGYASLCPSNGLKISCPHLARRRTDARRVSRQNAVIVGCLESFQFRLVPSTGSWRARAEPQRFCRPKWFASFSISRRGILQVRSDQAAFFVFHCLLVRLEIPHLELLDSNSMGRYL